MEAPLDFFKSKRGIRQGDPISPLLFVLGMEYFSRIMKYIRRQQEFQFHPRCSSLAINHLCFADDVVLCWKGEFKSVYMLLQGVKLFAATSGLQANPHKSEFYSCGLSALENKRIQDCLGFQQGSLPFKYLGVPINSKKISAADCEKLVDKMVMKIQVWSTRNISFARRQQLVNVVLLSISVYWSQIFILPKIVVKQINSICRSFLWTDCSNSLNLGM